MVPILSLERCTAIFHLKDIKADGTGFGALGAKAMTDGFLGILRHQGLKLRLGSLMLQKRFPGAAKETGKFRPGVRRTHIDNPDRLDPRLGWLNTKEVRRLAALDTAPELPLGRHNQVLIERIGMG